MPQNITAIFKNVHSLTLGFLSSAISFTGIVVIPMLLVLSYYTFIASDRYVSESQVTVKQSGSSAPDFNSLFASVSGGGMLGSKEDNLQLKSYILSLDMLNYLDANIGLRSAYQQHGDFLSRLSENASQEEFHKHYLKRIEVYNDDVTGSLVIRTQAFDPKFSQQINMAIMNQCERFINDSSHRIADEQLRFISGELARDNEALQAAKQELLAFQNRHNVLDPVEQARAASMFVLEMEAEQGRLEGELKNQRTFLAEDSFQINSLRNKLSALKEQIQEEKSKISGKEAGKLNSMSSQFMMLKFQAEFAIDKYKAALAAYEKTRVEALRKVKNLVVISSPHLQEKAEYPRRFYNSLTALLAFLTLYGIIRLFIATIEDHKD